MKLTWGLALLLLSTPTFAHTEDGPQSRRLRFVQIAAKDKYERSAIANTGVSIEATRSDSVWAFATPTNLERLRQGGFEILGDFDYSIARGGHETGFDFPKKDDAYHTYEELQAELKALIGTNSDIAKLVSIGKTIEGRDIWAVHITSDEQALETGQSTRPGAVIMGNHHAREHLSAEVPFFVTKHILDSRRDPKISALIDGRDIWIIPMVNPDGVSYDIATGNYRFWRKNRRNNQDGNYGVDLNRNYSYKWGTGGSDTDTASDVYMGPKPFSEPETQVIRDFVESHTNLRTLLTFHSYSELVLYPWGYTHDPVANTRDHDVLKKMADTMARWNKYTSEQTSDLYIASGDTTDWAYGTHGIFSFTIELSPNGWTGGGFYPGASMIDKAFKDNLRPCLYLIDVAADPYAVIEKQASRFFPTLIEETLPPDARWQ